MNSIRVFLIRFSSYIKQLFSKLGEISPFIYLFGYLITILVFSLIYYFLPTNSFYRLTIQYEYQFFKDIADPILRDLQTDLIQDYQNNDISEQVINGWRIVTNNLDIRSLDIHSLPSEFSFLVTIPINNGTEGKWDSWTFLTGTITVFTDDKFISNDVVYLHFKIDTPYTSPVEGIPSQIPTPSIVFNYEWANQKVASQGSVDVLPLSLSVYNKIIELGESPNPFQEKYNDQYLQMLYLSAGIATSNALGDIAPMSSQARLAITFEILFAVICLGLFLNALAYKIGETLKNYQKIDSKTSRIVPNSNQKRKTKH